MKNSPIKPQRICATIRFHHALNKKIWSNDDMRPEVRLRLLRGAISFYKFIGIQDLIVSDIHLTGSNAAFNYTSESDLDVHLVVDFGKLKNRDLAENIFATKKALWSSTFNAKIRGCEIEFYVEDSSEPAESNGVYSILHGKWIKHPKKEAPKRNDKSVIKKVEAFANEIDCMLDTNPSIDEIERLWSRIRKLRQNGLLDGGEFSVENLVFKALRSLGYLDKLWDAKNADTNKQLSLETTELSERIGVTKPTGLPQYSRAFLTWFGDSKVVDGKGNPLIVFHGTDKEFDEFDTSLTGDIGLHFGNAVQATNATLDFYGKSKENANILPVYLRIVNPLFVKDFFSLINRTWVIRAKHFTLETKLRFDSDERQTLFNIAKTLDKIRKKTGGDYALILRQQHKELRASFDNLTKQFWKIIETVSRRNGFDGMIYKNSVEGKGLSYVVFDANQAKSIFNSGAWSDQTNRISEGSYSDFSPDDLAAMEAGREEYRRWKAERDLLPPVLNDPADDFIDAVYDALEDSLCEISLHKFGPKLVELSYIGIKKENRGKGAGNRGMEVLTTLADKFDITLTLGIADDADPEEGLGWDDLHQWYQSWDFEGGSSMKRFPYVD